MFARHSLTQTVFLLVAVVAGCGGESKGGSSVGTGGTAGASGAAGGSAQPDACALLPSPPGMGICATPAGASYQGVSETSFDGQVLAVNGSPSSSDCEWMPLGPETFSLQVADEAGLEWTLWLTLPKFHNPVQVGDVISVSTRIIPPWLWADSGFMTLRSEDGALIAHFGSSTVTAEPGSSRTSLDYLKLPDGLHAELGAERCARLDGCGLVGAFDLEISDGPSSGVLPYGGVETLGEYSITHGGAWAAVTPMPACSDWFPNDISVSVAPSHSVY